MELIRVHAFTVPPGRLGGERPRGSALIVSPDLRAALATALADAPEVRQVRVNFRVVGAERSNAVRDLMLAYGFGSQEESDEAATSLADRLCDATDKRSHQCLMVLSAAEDGDQRQVAVWTFPQEAAYRFETEGPAPVIRLLDDVYSQGSSLRKAAAFSGTQRRDGFKTGWVLDLQASEADVAIAEYWIRRFLDCELHITASSGTRLLARVLREASNAVVEPTARAQLATAASNLPVQPRDRWSLAEVADAYLSEDAHAAFEAAVPNVAYASTPFQLDRTELRHRLGRQLFELHTGVWVSAPFDEIGKSVRRDGERLSVEGQIVSERLRSDRRG